MPRGLRKVDRTRRNRANSGGQLALESAPVARRRQLQQDLAANESSDDDEEDPSTGAVAEAPDDAGADDDAADESAEHDDAQEDEDSFDSADDRISDEEHDDSGDEDFRGDAVGDDESESEVEVETESNDSLMVGGTRRGRVAKRKAPRRAPAAKRPTRRSQRPPSNDSSEVELEESESDDEVGHGKKRARRPQPNGSRTKRAASRQIQDSDSSDEGLDDSEPESNGRKPRRKGKKSIRASAHRTSPRSSARKASRRLAKLKDEEPDDDILPKKRPSKRGKSEDDEYRFDDDDSAADEELSNGSEEEAEEGVGVVRDNEVGSVEVSSDDEKPAYKSPQLEMKTEIRPSPRKSIFDDSDEDNSDGDQAPTFTSPPKVQCTSKHDTITFEELPEKHVCFYGPDETIRQCFALETLRKIALIAVEQGRAQYHANGKLNFLQPPHFRSAMSPELQDQIASRFGRDALDIQGFYYDKKPAAKLKQDTDSDSEDSFVHSGVDRHFVELFQRYARQYMGSQDLYVCPLCYNAACSKQLRQTRLTSPKRRKGEKKDAAQRYDLDHQNEYDPMAVLGNLDKYHFELASVFCFKTAAQVKQHLREDHKVDTRSVKGNDLYTRYQIRAQDGLLQRHIRTISFTTTKQGFLQSYWFRGNNLDYILLLELVEEAQYYRKFLARSIDDSSDGSEMSDLQERFGKAQDFFDSFAVDTDELWDLICSPFSQDDGDLDDFLAGDDDDNGEGDDGEDAMAVYRAQQMEDARAEQEKTQQLLDRYDEADEDLEEEEEADDEEGDGDEEEGDEDNEEQKEEEDVKNGGYFEESSEEEDDWMEKKRKSLEAKRRRSRGRPEQKPKRRRSQPSPPIYDESSDGGLEKQDESPSKKRVTDDSDEETPKSGASSKRRISIADDDDDE